MAAVTMNNRNFMSLTISKETTAASIVLDTTVIVNNNNFKSLTLQKKSTSAAIILDTVINLNNNNFKSLTLKKEEITAYTSVFVKTEIPQNTNENGFNDWNYKVKLNPKNDKYIKQLTGQSAVSQALSYSELKELADNNPNITYDIDANGIITNFKVKRNS